MNKKYGWMITSSTKNIGDDFQCIAARGFLRSGVELEYIDREKMNMYIGPSVKMILNGWYMHNPINWPPASSIEPLLISMHISNTRQKSTNSIPSKVLLSEDGLDYFNRFAPVGCRDLFTLKLLKKKYVKAYFSGCLTMTLPYYKGRRGEYVCLVDPSDELLEFVKKRTSRDIVVIRPEKDDWPENYDERIIEAQKLLKVYSKAHMVITSRLHGALPSLAAGTPVLLLEKRFGDERYEGLKYFLNLATYKDLYSGRYPIDFENPLANPKEYLVLRKNLINICNSFLDGSVATVDFKSIHDENMNAFHDARKRTIKFNKQYKLESIVFREIKNHIRFSFRNVENLGNNRSYNGRKYE